MDTGVGASLFLSHEKRIRMSSFRRVERIQAQTEDITVSAIGEAFVEHAPGVKVLYSQFAGRCLDSSSTP